MPYHKYAELLGLRGSYCDDPGQVGKAAIHDPERKGLAAHGFRRKMAEVVEKLPGRDDK